MPDNNKAANFLPPRGTRIFFGDELKKRRKIENILRQTVEKFGFEEIITPTFEHEEIFTVINRPVNKKLYKINDYGERKLVLRPEMNAPICRTIGMNLYKDDLPQKFYYFAPVYRYERNQHGTYREFWQFGMEYMGAGQPFGEVEIIQVLRSCMEALSIEGYFFKISNLSLIYKFLLVLGIPEHKLETVAYKIRFSKSETEVKSILKQYGAKINRINYFLELRSKNYTIKQARQILNRLVKLFKELSIEIESLFLFFKVFEQLQLVDKTQVNFRLMRGTNHYNDSIFELHHPDFHGDICGGGRYDKMVTLYSNNNLKVPAVGAAFGFDRLALLSKVNFSKSLKEQKVLIIPLVDNISYIYQIIDAVSSTKTTMVLYPQLNEIRKALNYATNKNIETVVFIGAKEVKSKTLSILNLKNKVKKEILVEDFTRI